MTIYTAKLDDEIGRGLVRLSRSEMSQLGLTPGATVALQGQRTTHARVMPGVLTPGTFVCGPATLENAKADPDGDVAVMPERLGTLSSVLCQVACGGNLSTSSLSDAMFDMAVTEGDRYVLPVAGHGNAQVDVLKCDPVPMGLVGDTTSLVIEAPPREGHGYEGIGGLDRQISEVHEMIAAPLMRPDLFAHLGISPPRGVLFVGPPGSGKTLLARAVANKTKAAFFQIDGPEIVSKHYGDSEAALRQVFSAASKASPAILFIDEIDAIAPKRDDLSGDKQVERRLVAQLLTLMDGLSDRGRVVVMAATNLPNSLDPALRRPGRFDREVVFTAPEPAQRRQILGVHLAATPLHRDVDLQAIAETCHGYLGADLAALAREAAMSALRRSIGDAGGEDAVDTAKLCVTQADFTQAVKVTSPSILRGAGGPVAPVRFSDIGGLTAAKEALQRDLLWPLEHRSDLAALGLKPARGVLLTGPPGTGKTLLARAVAEEGGLNFVGVRPPQLLSQYLGQAETAVAELFDKARQSAPTLLFFDEFDALAAHRAGQDANMVRLLAQLLVEIDGTQGEDDVLMLAATNRAGAIDPALIRPGRFDTVIELPMPSLDDREKILAVHLEGRRAAPDLDLGDLAKRSNGMSGADLANLVNAAARLTLQRVRADGADAQAISQADLLSALAAWAKACAARGKDHLTREALDA